MAAWIANLATLRPHCCVGRYVEDAHLEPLAYKAVEPMQVRHEMEMDQ